MKPEKLAELMAVLRSSGVSRFKNQEFEVEFHSLPQSFETHDPKPVVTEPKVNPILAKLEAEAPIPHKVEELTSLLKLSDTDLLDRLFPDEESPEAEQTEQN